jgi:hypothetical protein
MHTQNTKQTHTQIAGCYSEIHKKMVCHYNEIFSILEYCFVERYLKVKMKNWKESS